MTEPEQKRGTIRQVFERHNLGDQVSDLTPSLYNIGYVVHLLDTQSPETHSYQKLEREFYDHMSQWIACLEQDSPSDETAQNLRAVLNESKLIIRLREGETPEPILAPGTPTPITPNQA